MTTTDPLASRGFRQSILCDRLRIREEDLLKKLEGFATTYSPGSGKIFVHFCKGAELAVFEDAADMYPSDTLVTAMRLCL